MANWKYAIGPWVLDFEDGSSFWRPPTGTAGMVDLRSTPDQSTYNSGDRPYGFFTVDPLSVLGIDYKVLGIGDCREIVADEAMRNAWQEMTGYKPKGEFLVDLLWDQLTDGSDPTGDTLVKPLLPGSGGLKLILAGHSVVKRGQFNIRASTPHADRVRRLLQLDYERIYNEFQRFANRKLREHPRKVLDYWVSKYGLSRRDRSWEMLLPQHMRNGHPGPLPHETSVSDNFNRGDESLDAGNWTELDGFWSIRTNQVYATSQTTNGLARYDTDLSGDDVVVFVDAISHDDNMSFGVIARKDSSSTKTYYAYWGRDLAFNNQFLRKVVSGTVTNLDSSDTAIPVPANLRLEVDGSSLSAKIDGSLSLSSTDSAITAQLRCGIIAEFGDGTNDEAVGDNWQAEDIAVLIEGNATQTIPRWSA